MVRFVRTLQHRTTAHGRDFYQISIPPQVAEALDLKDGGIVAICINPSRKGKFNITISRAEDDKLNH